MSNYLFRFVGLSEGETKHLSCSICLNVFENAIITHCGHTFCKTCLYYWIVFEYHRECPQCREGFKLKNFLERDGENNLIIISNYVFTRNLVVNAMVDELTIECVNSCRGCEQTIKLGLRSTHLKECEFRLCESCGITFGKVAKHNCLELLKRQRDQLLDQNSILRKDNYNLENKVKQLESNYEKRSIRVTKIQWNASNITIG